MWVGRSDADADDPEPWEPSLQRHGPLEELRIGRIDDEARGALRTVDDVFPGLDQDADDQLAHVWIRFEHEDAAHLGPNATDYSRETLAEDASAQLRL